MQGRKFSNKEYESLVIRI